MFYRYKMNILGCFLAFLLLATPEMQAFADGTTMIGLSSNSAEVGGKVTVTISGSDSSTLSLRYNNEVFKFVSCSNAGAVTDGNVVTFTGQSGDVTFEAIGSGSGDLIVSSDTLSGSSVSVPVSGQTATSSEESEPEEETEEEAPEETAGEEPAEAESEEESAAEEQAPEETSEKSQKKSNASTGDGDFVIGGVEYVLSERFSDSEIPDGYKKKTLHIHGGTYDELSNGVFTLVYLKPADNIEGSGEFYIYDEDLDNVSKYAALGSPEYFITVEKPDELISDLFEKTKITVGGETFKVYQIGEDMTDFYFVYGTDPNGNTGWYSYDSAKETIQRANEQLLNMAQAPSADDEDPEEHISIKKVKGETNFELSDILGTPRTLAAIAIFFLVVIFVIIIDILLFRGRGRDDGYEDEEEYPYPEEKEEKAPTVDDILEEKDFDEANKPHHGKLFNRKKSTDIWDTGDQKINDTSSLAEMDDASKLKKQVFKSRAADSSRDADEGMIDVIDFNDL